VRQSVLSVLRSRVSILISQRSVVRRRQYPTRANSLVSFLFIVFALPLALLVLPITVVSALTMRRRLRVAVLDIENEFAPFIEIMEYLRSVAKSGAEWDLMFVLSKYSHNTLDDIYSREFQCPVIRRRGLLALFQQVVLLQPAVVLVATRFTGNRTFALPQRELPVSDVLVSLRKNVLDNLGFGHTKYVAMAVYTLQYDEERDPREAKKHAILESHGDDLVAGIDYLYKSNVGVVLLGSEDTKTSRIPREVPRLSSFGELGGAQEVALASGCNYFWNDSDVGAWWLGLPFKRPILTTNKPRIRLKTDFTGYEHLVVPVRYRRVDGTFVTFRDLLSMKSAPFKEASAGRLLIIRNSPDEIIEAHREMKARIDGTWNEDSTMKMLGERCRKVFADYPEAFPMTISSYFLRKHQYLLE